MNYFILKIIIFIAAATSLIMGFYMLFIHDNAKSVKGPLFWAVGDLLLGLGFIIRIETPTGGLLFGVSMLFITVGLYADLAGIWSFKEKEMKRWILFGFPSFDIIQILFFSFIIPISRIRLALHLGVMLVFTILAIYEMLELQGTKRYLRKVFRLNAFSFSVFLGILVMGLILILVHPQHQIDKEYAWLIALGVIGGLLTAITFGFLSAVNLKLYNELEEQLVTKNKFFSIITHDLKGPVGTLMAFVDLINNNKELDEEQREKVMESLEVLSQSSYHLLQNLLDWTQTSSNIAELKKEQVDLNKLIVSNIRFYRSLMLLKSIQLEFQQDENVFIHGNPEMIETIVRNLVSNAIKFTPKEGKVTITLRKDKKGVHLIVADTGVGIEPARLEQIFELEIENVSTTRGTDGERGSGMGLAICKDFVTKNRGTIRVQSKVNEGTRFVINFPPAE